MWSLLSVASNYAATSAPTTTLFCSRCLLRHSLQLGWRQQSATRIIDNISGSRGTRRLSSLNVRIHKILDDIQSHKTKTGARSRKTNRAAASGPSSSSSSPSTPPPSSSPSSTPKRVPTKVPRSTALKQYSATLSSLSSSSSSSAAEGIQLSAEAESIIEQDTASLDIFKELSLESFSCENLPEERDFMSNSSVDEGSHFSQTCDLFDDTALTKRNLLSFIHVCTYSDALPEAHAFFLEFVGKFGRSLPSADTAQCAELLIKGWARKGNTENVRELMRFITSTTTGQKQRLTVPIFEYYLLSLVKQLKRITAADVRGLLQEMAESGLSPQFLFYRSTLSSAELRLLKETLDRLGIRLHTRRYQHPRAPPNKHLVALEREQLPAQPPYDPFAGVADLQTGEQMTALLEEQLAAEMAATVKVPPVPGARFYDLEPRRLPAEAYQRLLDLLEAEWRETLAAGFAAHLDTVCSRQKRLNGIPYHHYLSILEPEFYVQAMLEEIRRCATFSEHYSPFASQLFEALGRRVMGEYLLRSNTADGTLADFKRCYAAYAVEYTRSPALMGQHSPREYWQQRLVEAGGHHFYFDESKQWPVNVLRELGKDLYEVISADAHFNSVLMGALQQSGPSEGVSGASTSSSSSLTPVISFVYKSHDCFKTKREVRVHPLLIRLYEGACSAIHFETERLPMLSPPVPWVATNFGGNLLVPNFVIRLPAAYPRAMLRRTPVTQFYPTFDALNALSLCPWKINGRLLDIATSIFKDRGNLELDIPISLSKFGPLPRSTHDMTPKEKAYTWHRRKLQKKEQAEMYSLWVDCLYKLSIGHYLRDRTFWFPINTDFRSRVYPIPPNFNHLGSDLSRSLLLFAKGSPLGERGLDWLKVHLINLTGLKKRCSVAERLAYADEILEELIMDSADRPLEGRRWWMQADEKWQTLAACIELTAAVRSGDPASYVSHLAIHQDGSCNGLQHYAALGRDLLGARSVNLVPAEVPQDVYSDVAALVEAEIERDAAAGVEIAAVVRGFITRKVVKQTVMTYVYGVTKYGAKLQVLKRLREDAAFPEGHKVTASLYISEKIFASIGRMFKQTRAIQDWLTGAAQIISAEYGATVDWVTPLGFPVIQPYFKTTKKNSKGEQATSSLMPNTMKQKNGFPPNFIHSLDSSHMMLTALGCHRAGLTFASVHDCFWTHASQVDTMNGICRRTFVGLHEEPILDNLAAYLARRLEEVHNEGAREMTPAQHRQLLKAVHRTIPKGDFDLKQVLDSVYFFS